jgi:hypothetical protein
MTCTGPDDTPFGYDTDLLIAVGACGAIVVDEAVRTGLPHMYAAATAPSPTTSS